MAKLDLVAIEKAAKDRFGGNLDLAIVDALGYHSGRAGGVPPFLTKEVAKIKGQITKAKAKKK